MPHLFERAPTGRAKCRGCGTPIAKGDVRFGEAVPNPFADAEGAETTHWYHPACGAYKRPESFLAAIADVTESWPDHEHLAHAARVGVDHRRAGRVDQASRAPSARAACRACRQPIAKGDWRLALVFYEDGRFAPSGFIHLGCVRAYLETVDIMDRIRHFSPSLGEADIAEITAAIEAGSPTPSGGSS